jgi:hypothetical protein
MGYSTGDASSGTSFVENEILKPKDRGECEKGDRSGVEHRKPPKEHVMEEVRNEEEKTLDGAEKSRVPSAAGWEVTSEADDGDSRGWEGRERKTMAFTEEPDAMMISRTHSMSMSSKPPADSRLLPINRSESEPRDSHSHTTENRGKDPKL